MFCTLLLCHSRVLHILLCLYNVVADFPLLPASFKLSDIVVGHFLSQSYSFISNTYHLDSISILKYGYITDLYHIRFIVLYITDRKSTPFLIRVDVVFVFQEHIP